MTHDSSEHLKRFFRAIGLSSEDDPELAETPERVDALLRHLFSGLEQPAPTLSTFTATQSIEPVMVTGIQCRSTCVHHLLPILGFVDVAYVPDTTMAGFGGFARVVDHWSFRPQVQERLVEQIADDLQSQLEPNGLLVRLRTRQLCVEMRTQRPPGTYVSVASRGSLVDGDERHACMRAFRSSQSPI